MAEISMDERVKLASGFLVDAPPGEFHEVLNDVRVLIANDAKLQIGIKSAVHEYNLSQFITSKLDTSEAVVMVNQYAELDDENTFYCPRLKQKFKFDHIRQLASKPEPHDSPVEQNEKWRLSLDNAVNKYVLEHFPNGVSAVYLKDAVMTVCIVSNKYNPTNFWNGRWRSEWKCKVGSSSASGVLRANVHYYEDGNVQLNTDKECLLNLPSSNTMQDAVQFAESMVKLIKDAEMEYQTALNESYVQLADNTFKSLRRVLPITRNKLDWNKILNYKIGNSLAAAAK